MHVECNNLRRMRTTSCRAIGVLSLALLAAGCQRLVDREIERNLGRARAELLREPGLHVVLCGTGSPLPDPHRAGACTAVLAGGEFVLVDAGPGSWEVVDLANLPTAALSGVLLTHFHSDHIGDLGEAVTQSWIAGRTKPLDVFGPPGTAAVVDGLRRAYAGDVEARVAHHGDAAMPRAAAGAVAHEVPLDDAPTAEAVVFERNGLKVTMFRVDHDPVRPAVGYRFDYQGRSVVVSGDTRRSENLVAHARGVDVLVHEAMRSDAVQRASEVAARTGRPRLAKLAGDITTYHTDVLEVAAVARDAGVGHLVLTHLVPAPSNVLTRRLFVRGVGDVYGGPVTLGEDGTEITLPPRTT